MREIQGKPRTVRELLKGVKYAIDYYQREYKWQDEQIRELIDDLSGKFLEEYQPDHSRGKVGGYPHYFLGSIIITKKDNTNYIVDGQQRLTSLTLLLIFLRNLQNGREDQVNIDELIFSEKFGEKSFNLHVDERLPCMEALFADKPFDLTNWPESVVNIYRRYHAIEESFPEELRQQALPYFIDWLLENVHLIEITAFSDDDAYTVFETMNDRGLRLTPTEMLKGYLLASIEDPAKRVAASERWRNRIQELNEVGKEVESDSFKTWFRSQYATKIRERRKGAKPEDFDRIGTEFHRWLRDSSDAIGLSQSDDFYTFIDRNFDFYSRQYLRLIKASRELVPPLEHVQYNARHGFTLQYMLLLAPLKPDDSDEVVLKKQRLTAHFVDILLTWRLWNFRLISYNTMQYAMFLVMREIRGLDSHALAQRLHDTLSRERETFDSNERLYVHVQNRYALQRILARMTDYVEAQSGQPSRYLEYVADSGNSRYEVEHIWANKPERHTDEFANAPDFNDYRQRIGGLLLLPKSFNASYGALRYEEKLPHYNTQNLLARSLHPLCYEHNPGFLKFVERSGLPFRPHPQFRKADIDERGALYRAIAQQLWNPEDLLREVES
ncbi:MAG: DUF262 domain-containing protein [Anaerolineae bacterium]|nr:DUF262 domain-containing protein [Anaerolineae bacterium]